MRTLIAYATKHGTAETCVRLLADQLEGETIVTNLAGKSQPDPAGFDRVIIGGSIYIGKIQPAVSQYLAKNQSVLLQKKLGLFICCMSEGDKASEEIKLAFPDELLTHATASASFGGAFFFKKMGWIERKMIKMVAKHEMTEVDVSSGQDIDRIDKSAIEKFATAMNA